MATEKRRVHMQLPEASTAITVIRVGDNLRPAYAGRSERSHGSAPEAEATHFVSVRKGVVLQGTLTELREFTGELGLAIAEVELDELRLQVDEGRRLAAHQESRLA